MQWSRKGCVFNCDVLPCEVKDKVFTPSVKYMYFAYSYILSVRSRVSFEGFVVRIEHTFRLFHREVMGSFSVQWLHNRNPNSPTDPTPYFQRLAPPASFGPSALCIQLPAKKCTRGAKFKGKNLKCFKCKIFLLLLEEEDN